MSHIPNISTERPDGTALTDHSRVATDALEDLLVVEHPEITDQHVVVWRRRGGLQAVITAVPPLSRELAAVAAVHVRRALRAFDRWADGIDVSISPEKEDG